MPGRDLGFEYAHVEDFSSPITIPGQMSPDDRARLESFGVSFESTAPLDQRLIAVQLPKGWRKLVAFAFKGSRHLVDTDDRWRAALSYGQDDWRTWVLPRYSIGFNREALERNAHQCIVTDGAVKVIHSTAEYPFQDEDSEQSITVLNTAVDQASAWLSEHYPDWRWVDAYRD